MTVQIKAGAVAIQLIGHDVNFLTTLKKAERGLNEFCAKARDLTVIFGTLRTTFQTMTGPLTSTLSAFASFESGMSRMKVITIAAAEEICKLQEQAKMFGSVMSSVTSATTTETIANTAAIGTNTTALVANTIATTAAIVATRGFMGAIQAVLAIIRVIPGWGWAITGVAALITLVSWLTVATKKIAELHHEMSNVRENGDNTRSVDEKKLKRLQQLQELQNLSNAEMAEAQQLAQELTGRYGNVGVGFDKFTGKINLAADAMERFMEAMNAKALQELEAELKEAQANLDEINREGEHIQTKGNFGWAFRAAGSFITGGGFKNKEGLHGEGWIWGNDYKNATEQEKWWNEKKKPALEAEHAIRKKIAAIMMRTIGKKAGIGRSMIWQ